VRSRRRGEDESIEAKMKLFAVMRRDMQERRDLGKGAARIANWR
jgi:hypothetical protein